MQKKRESCRNCASNMHFTWSVLRQLRKWIAQKKRVIMGACVISDYWYLCALSYVVWTCACRSSLGSLVLFTLQNFLYFRCRNQRKFSRIFFESMKGEQQVSCLAAAAAFTIEDYKPELPFTHSCWWEFSIQQIINAILRITIGGCALHEDEMCMRCER